MTPDKQPVETELKFVFPVGARGQIENHPVLAAAAAENPVHQISTYYDTSNLALAEAGFSLRVRVQDAGVIQTLKSTQNGNPLASRGEWEWPLHAAEPDLTLLRDTPAASFADAQVEPLVSTDIHRVTRLIQSEGGTVVEAALDVGHLQAGDRQQPVRELELELKDGPAAGLFQLADTLAQALPLRLEPEPKGSRAFRLMKGGSPAVIKAAKPDLPRNVTVADGVRQVMSAAIGGLQANMPAALAGDAEGIHQMRIAVRRLRTTLVLFKPDLDPGAVAGFDAPLRTLGQILGEARDWDVFTQQTMPAALNGACPATLQDAAQTRRQDALNHMVETLQAPETTRLILRLMAWVQDETLIPDPSMRHRKLAKLAPDLLSRLEHKVAKRGKHIAKLSGEDLHSVRKSLKKLRYAVDDVAGLFPVKAVKRYRKHCTHLQEQLGTINDAAMAITLGKSLQASDIIQWARKRRGKATGKLPDQWAEFRHAHPFWA